MTQTPQKSDNQHDTRPSINNAWKVLIVSSKLGKGAIILTDGLKLSRTGGTIKADRHLAHENQNFTGNLSEDEEDIHQ